MQDASHCTSPIKGGLCASTMNAKEPNVHEGRFNALAGNAKGWLACLNKTQGTHDKTWICDNLDWPLSHGEFMNECC